MDKLEIINRSKIKARELKVSLIKNIEDQIKAFTDFLDSEELRISKESLTGGEPTFKEQQLPDDVPGSGRHDDHGGTAPDNKG